MLLIVTYVCVCVCVQLKGRSDFFEKHIGNKDLKVIYDFSVKSVGVQMDEIVRSYQLLLVYS